MADAASTGSGRICPSCGRRVPHNVTVCRCGARLPAAELYEAEEPPRATSVWALLGPALFAIAGFVWFFYFRPTPPAPAVTIRHSIGPPPAGLGYLTPDMLGPPAPRPQKTNAEEAAPIEMPRAAPEPPSPAIDEMVARVMPAVVQIEAGEMRGSAFFVAYDTLITNFHVVNQETYVTIKVPGGITTTARVDARAPNLDLAILKVAQPSSAQVFIPLASTDSLREGQEVIAIGSALGSLQNTVTRGVIGGLRAAGAATMIQHDAAINPGNSGGPLLDRQGRVIGVNTLTYTDKPGIAFAVVANHVSDLLAGRIADVGTTPGGLSDIRAQARRDESERRQQQGEQQFKSRIAKMVENAKVIDADWKQFRLQCYTSPIGGRYDREWFAIMVPAAVSANLNSNCSSFFTGIKSNVDQFRNAMREIIAATRRADLLPGTVRDVLRSNQLDFEWDR